MRFHEISFAQLKSLYACVNRMERDTVTYLLEWIEDSHMELFGVNALIKAIEDSPAQE
jgi:hypothetical protein